MEYAAGLVTVERPASESQIVGYAADRVRPILDVLAQAPGAENQNRLRVSVPDEARHTA